MTSPNHPKRRMAMACAALLSAVCAAGASAQVLPADEAAAQEASLITLADLGLALPGRAAGDAVITTDEFLNATAIYRAHCAVCHGQTREGAVGTPLEPDIMQSRGYDYLTEVITFGLNVGMPNWGASGVLDKEKTDLMVRYLMVDPPPVSN